MYGRQSYKVGDKHRFWGGLNVEAVGGGPGLVQTLFERAAEAGHRGALRDGRAPAAPGRRGARDRGATRSAGRLRARSPARAVVIACGRLRGEPGVAHALPRAGLGPREGARHPAQHRRGHPHGARDRRAGLRPLVVLPRGGLGPQRAALRRPARRRHVPEALVPARAHRQRPRRALRGRGRGLPQLHLCQVRPRDPAPAAARRVPDLRPEDGRACCATSTASARSPRPRRTPSRSWPRSSTSTRRGSRRTVRDFNAAVRPGAFNPAVLDGKRHARASRRRSPTGRCRSTRRPTWASR